MTPFIRVPRGARRACHGVAVTLLVLGVGLPGPARAVHESVVTDNHPAGGPGATNQPIVVPSFGEPGSPLSQGPEAPGMPHLHGPWIGNTSYGHADPHTLDPAFYLGHGIGEPLQHSSPPMSGGGSPPMSGGGSPPPGNNPPDSGQTNVASRDVELREVIVPLGNDGRAVDAEAELAALFGQTGWFDALFVRAPPPPPEPEPKRRSTAPATPEYTPEQNARYHEIIDLNAQFATRTAQYRTVLAEFNAHLEGADILIERANANGLPGVAEQIEKDKVKIAAQRDERLDYAMGQSAKTARELNAAYARNELENLGPGTGTELVAEMAARKDFRRLRFIDGKLVEVNTLGADQEVVTRTGESAGRQAEGAPKSTTHASIFTDITDEGAWRDFAIDYSDTFYEYLDDPALFAERYAAYAKGAGLAIKDGVVDLAVLGVELGDTILEIDQAALNALFGTDIDIVGSENIEFLYNAAAAASQLDSNAIFTTTDRFLSHFERRFEQMAGSGEKGIQEALQGTGYVFTTIVGGEEIAFRAVALGAKGIKIVRLGRADEVLAAGDEVAGAARAATSSGTGTVAPPGASSADDVTPVFPDPNRAAQATPPAGGPPSVKEAPNGGALITNADGRTVRLPDGQEFVIGQRLGGGGSSTAFAVPGRTDVVVKETTLSAGNAGAAFDRAGYKVINDIDPSLAPKQIGEAVVIDGKQYTVFERADSYQEWRLAEAQRQGIDIPMKEVDGKMVPDKQRIELDMTPGQLSGYQRGMNKLHDQGFVFLDNKIDNWALVPGDGPDVWELKIIDPGSIIKLTDPNAARRLQAKIDYANHGDQIQRMYVGGGNPRMAMAVIRDEIAGEFDQFLDKDAMAALGLPINSLNDVPYNPVHGLQNPSVRSLHEVDIANLSDAEFADFLRDHGWSDSQIDELIDLPPQLRADSVRGELLGAADDLPGAAARGTPPVDSPNWDTDMADYLRKQDPGYWTEERLRAYFEQPVEPNPWGDNVDDLMGDDVPTVTPAGNAHPGFRDAVTELDAENAAKPAAPPELSFIPKRDTVVARSLAVLN